MGHQAANHPNGQTSVFPQVLLIFVNMSHSFDSHMSTGKHERVNNVFPQSISFKILEHFVEGCFSLTKLSL